MSIFVAGRITVEYYDDQSGIRIDRQRYEGADVIETIRISVKDLRDLEYVVSRMRQKQDEGRKC